MPTTKTRPRSKPRGAKRREVHATWIELTDLGQNYAVWKTDEGGEEHLQVSELALDRLPSESVEFEFEVSDFLGAAEEILTRKKPRKKPEMADEEPYGGPATFSNLYGGNDFGIEKYGPQEYAIVAACGDTTELTGAELRLLARTIRELPSTTGL
jgi:hypothetical protein